MYHHTPEGTATEVFDWGSIKFPINGQTAPDAGITQGEVIVNPGKGHARHQHPESTETIFVLSGEGRQIVDDGEPFPIKAGDFVYVPRNAPHSTDNTSWEPLRLLVTYNPSGAEQALRNAPDYARLEPGQLPTWSRPES